MAHFVLHHRIHNVLLLLLVPVGFACQQVPLSSSAANQPDLNMLRNQRPEWITRIPEAHFVGVASQVENIQKGREEAVNDVRRQIVSALGTEISLFYRSETIYDDPDRRLQITDIVENTASGYLQDVETNIIAYYEETAGTEGGINTWVLVSYPPEKIEAARGKLHADNRKTKALVDAILDRAAQLTKEHRVYQALEQFESAIVVMRNLLLGKRASRDRAIEKIDQLLRSTSLRVHGVYPARSSTHTHALYLAASFRSPGGRSESRDAPLPYFPLLVNFPMNGQRQVQVLMTDQKGLAIFPFSVPVIEGEDQLIISVPQPVLREYRQAADPFLRNAVDMVQALYQKRERIITLSRLLQRDPPLLFPKKPRQKASNAMVTIRGLHP